MSANLHIRPREELFSSADLVQLASTDAQLSLEETEGGELSSITFQLGLDSFELSFSPEEISTVQTPTNEAISKIYELADELHGDIYDDYGDKWDETGNIPIGDSGGMGRALLKVLLALSIGLAAFWLSR